MSSQVQFKLAPSCIHVAPKATKTIHQRQTASGKIHIRTDETTRDENHAVTARENTMFSQSI